ncbi:phage tail protein [Paraburkholderia bryophila]|uniref:phage tail protein n=1 Tax=Paraburkholderia bryophila TaxID=420952 RepID=UPI0038BD49DB
MIKTASLRAALVAAIPELAINPERLTIFLDEGHILATGTRTPSFEYRYTAHAIVQDFAGDSDHVFIAIVEWARANQPDLVTNADERERGITFEADILNNETVDLSIRLQLTESIVVSADASGARTIKHVDDSADHWLG